MSRRARRSWALRGRLASTAVVSAVVVAFVAVAGAGLSGCASSEREASFELDVGVSGKVLAELRWMAACERRETYEEGGALFHCCWAHHHQDSAKSEPRISRITRKSLTTNTHAKLRSCSHQGP